MPKHELAWRCDCSFPDHWKHGALARILNVSHNEALAIVTRLFSRVMRLASSGDLSRVEEGILRAWTNSKKVTKEALVQAGWLEQNYHVHDWANRYGSKAVKRAEAAAKKRSQRSHLVPNNGGQEDRNTTTGDSNHVPTLSPLSQPNIASQVGTYPETSVELHMAYCEATGRDPERTRLDDKKAAKYAELIAWAGSLKAAKRGIRKVGASPHHRGQNETGKRYDNLLVDRPFRTAVAFQGWCEDAAPPVSKNPGSIDWDALQAENDRVNAERRAKEAGA